MPVPPAVPPSDAGAAPPPPPPAPAPPVAALAAALLAAALVAAASAADWAAADCRDCSICCLGGGRRIDAGEPVGQPREHDQSDGGPQRQHRGDRDQSGEPAADQRPGPEHPLGGLRRPGAAAGDAERVGALGAEHARAAHGQPTSHAGGAAGGDVDLRLVEEDPGAGCGLGAQADRPRFVPGVGDGDVEPAAEHGDRLLRPHREQQPFLRVDHQVRLGDRDARPAAGDGGGLGGDDEGVAGRQRTPLHRDAQHQLDRLAGRHRVHGDRRRDPARIQPEHAQRDRGGSGTVVHDQHRDVDGLPCADRHLPSIEIRIPPSSAGRRNPPAPVTGPPRRRERSATPSHWR